MASAKHPPPIGWDLYRSLLGVLDEGSLSGAARALGLTQPTVGRHVAALEQALATPLFVRSPTGLVPTEAALALRGHAQAMAATAAAIERTVASQGDGADLKGVVRITASEVIGLEALPGIVASLRESHPALKVELVLTNRVQDLLRHEADLAIRMTPPQQSQLVARRVGSIELGLHAHPDYLKRHGTPRKLEDLTAHTIIGYDRETAFLRAVARHTPGLRRDHFDLRSDSDAAQVALLRAGAGIGVCQVPIGRRDGLVRLLPRALAWPLETWITMHEDLRHSARCRVAFDALVEGMTAWIGQR